MKQRLKHQALYGVFVGLLFCCFMPCSFAKEQSIQLTQKEIAGLKAFVECGLKYIKEKGKEEAYKEFSNPKGKFREGDKYLFVDGYDGKVLAHGGDPKRWLGKSLLDAKGKFGTPFFGLFIEAARRGGGLVSYYWYRYGERGAIGLKTAYIEPLDDHTFIGAGYYQAGP